MAAITHTTSAPYSSLSISHNSTDSTITGLHLSQPAPGPFDVNQPVNSTQTSTSPASRAHQQIMPLNMATYGPANGHHLQPATPRGIADLNGHVAHQIYPPNYRPQIYTVSLSSYYDRSSSNSMSFSRRNIRASPYTRWRSANLWSCADEKIHG